MYKPYSKELVSVKLKSFTDILMSSHISVILAKRLVSNIRYPKRHAQRILSRKYKFIDIYIGCYYSLGFEDI